VRRATWRVCLGMIECVVLVLALLSCRHALSTFSHLVLSTLVCAALFSRWNFMYSDYLSVLYEYISKYLVHIEHVLSSLVSQRTMDLSYC